MNRPAADTEIGKLIESYLRDLEAGAAPDREAVLARHPELAEALAPALAGLEFVHDAALNLKKPARAEGLSPGEALGDFRLLREVGRGGMGVVYEAEQLSLGRRVALKVLPFAAVFDPRQRQRFKNEALAAAQLRHAHIVPVYAVGCERGIDYYAMQYIEGGTVATVIREMKGAHDAKVGAGPPTSSHASNREPSYLRTAAVLARQAADALDHAHQVGIVHRDVKPGNLLVDRLGALWVADFGLARSAKDVGLTMSGELVGTVRYMSPEQALAQRAPIDHRTDVYSLGATLYELVTLEPPFAGDDLHVLLQDIVSKDPPSPRRLNPALPIDLETILLKAMAKDPAGRYATAQEMGEDLGHYLEDKPIVARRPSLAERTARWTRRHRGLVAAGVTVLLVAAAASTVGAKREERNTRVALESAEAARIRAEANLGLAYKAVQEFLTKVGTSRFEEQPTCTPELRALFVQALGFYDVYLAQRRDPGGHVDRSYILAALGRHDEALAAAEQAIAIDPRFESAHFARGNALRMLKRPEEALRAFDDAIAITPGDAKLHLQRGVILSELGRAKAAIAEWDRALAIDPDLPLALNNRAFCLLELGQHEKALPSLDRAIEIAPNFARAHENRSIALTELKRFEEALVAIDRAIALLPDAATAHMHRSGILATLGRRLESLEAVERAIALDPKFGRAHYNRSLRLLDLGRRDAALKELEIALELEPSYAPAHGNRGFLLRDLGRYDEALVELDRAAALDGGVRAHCGRGEILHKLGRLPEALAAFDRAIVIDSSYFPALTNRAVVLNRLGRHAEALDGCERAIEVDSRAPIAHVVRCTALVGLMRREDALAAAELAIALDERMADAHERRGACLESLGRRDEAFSAYDRAIELGYRNAGLMNKVAWKHAASPEQKDRNVSRALEIARLAVKLAPNDPTARNTLGVALCRAEKWDDALAALNEAMSLRESGSPFDWFFAAIASWKLGRKDEARQWYEKAVGAMDDDDRVEELRLIRVEASTLLGPP